MEPQSPITKREPPPDERSAKDTADEALLLQAKSWNRFGTVLTVGFCLFLFWPMLTGTGEAGFRDSASLYQPLFEWTRDQWLNGHIPLWCSLDNWGGPVVADATSSVFYPAKIIFLITAVPFSVLFGAYLAGHVMLAVLGARWCGSVFGLSPPAQWLSAIGFGFGGSVLFQTCNVVFLVGAAWLPWALGLILRIQQSVQDGGPASSIGRPCMGLSLVLASMVLGGDPQMAFHVLLASILVVLFCSRSTKSLIRTFAVFGLVAVVALAFSAIQVLPSMDWAAKSERVAETVETNIQSFVKRPKPGSPRDSVYQFSLPPWSMLEFVWPNALGKLDFATNWRWSNSIAGADRVWTGSIYSGCVLFLLSISFVLRGQRSRLDFAMMSIILLFVLGSFGWYGVGWLVNELQLMRGGLGLGGSIGEPVGGVYWLMEMLLPGFSSFRYPAKLMVVATLPICLLAGRGMDHAICQPAGERLFKCLFRLCIFLSIVSALIAVVCILNRASFANQIMASAVHTTFVLVSFVFLMRARSYIRTQQSAWVSKLVVLLCSFELLLAVSWTVCVADRNEDSVPRQPITNSPIYRPSTLEDISHYKSWDDLPVQLDIDRQLLYPKHHLLRNQRVIGSFHSIQPTDVSVLLSELSQLDLDHQRRVLAALSVSAQLKFGQLDRDSTRKAELVQWDGRPRYYVAQQIECVPEIDGRVRADVISRTREFISLFAYKALDPAVRTQVECDSELMAGLQQPEKAELSVVEESQKLVRLNFTSTGKQIVVVGDYDDGNWQAWKVADDGSRSRLSGVRVNRVLRGYVAVAGSYAIEVVYQPSAFFRGAWISGLAWGLVIGWWIGDRLVFLRRRLGRQY